jgi:NAD(P)-dependent dehydrogenase (short-subunit alcohol dehydrogenase family)
MSERNVLITGCSTGIGRALARACIARGDTVVATARNIDDLQYLDHENAIRMALDVNDDTAIQGVFSEIRERIGHIDILINNAGYAAMGPVTELSRDQLLRQFETNVLAPVSVTREALSMLRASDNAQVINIGSVSGILTTPFSGAYCATKAALHSLSDAMRMELAPFGIEVITVQPGAIQSSFGDNSLAGVSDLLKPDSLFKSVEDKIRERAVASQQNPTTAEAFAKEMLLRIQGSPAPELRIGNGSTALPMMKRWLPLRLLDRILSRKFGLDRLKG